jgi:hypothetical protein
LIERDEYPTTQTGKPKHPEKGSECISHIYGFLMFAIRLSYSFPSIVVTEGNITMKARTLISIVFSLGSVVSLAQSGHITEKQYSRAELRQQIQTAHNPQQYQALADYFRQQQKSFEAKASAEKLVWDARAQNSASGNKYPRPVDSAHYLYDSYSYDADRAGKQADHYEQLARSTGASL